ncbi:PNK3P-domain-containing protein [Fomitiporia mediterranea MF3/22]|uniref:PNK3P-domain-containing protein n=1 Tax=Fomitiporia mediterranea (strain MF3/22) TaxID=694068 RepID=UPI000440798A|nr:PNK3P-domain-containing protein [Fomitiporia mediterranea MF3/22]EJD05401.1 PNK3P-domain-containing protein [Fomitiporia mediterranea MF3/22]
MAKVGTSAATAVKKRSAKDIETEDASRQEPPTKRVFPIFAKPGDVATVPEPAGPLRWKQPPFLPSTCILGENLNAEIRPSIAGFDLDGTVIKFAFSKSGTEWEFWHKCVPMFLKEAYDAGHTVVFFSNQLYPEKKLAQWRQKIQLIAKELHEIPFLLFAATARDSYRKPMPGMWLAIEKLAREAGVTLDKQKSFFVGDAAGRKEDHAGTDRKFAGNVGIKFLTPEEYFLKRPAKPYELKGFNPNQLPPNEGPRITPTSSPILPATEERPEIVIFVGPPASGKTSLFESSFQPAGYEHVNQDTLGSRPKCLKAAEAAIRKGVSCVVDNTNRDKKTRKYYVDLAKSLSVPIRCFVFKVSTDLAWHNNLYRAYCLPLIASTNSSNTKPKLIPYTALASFPQAFEEPTAEEGFKDVKIVNWQFQGDEVQERYWRMWLQIDGK